MTLLTSGRIRGPQCGICGTPNGACGHTDYDDTPTIEPDYGPPTIIARAAPFGTEIDILASTAEAEAKGWQIVANRDGTAYHKKRPAPVAPEPNMPTVRELRVQAKTLGIAGAASMSKAALATAIAAHQ